MSDNLILVITSAGVIISIISSAVIVGITVGTLKTKIRVLETQMHQVENSTVTKEDLALALTPLRETLAEIRGMFRLELKDP